MFIISVQDTHFYLRIFFLKTYFSFHLLHIENFRQSLCGSTIDDFRKSYFFRNFSISMVCTEVVFLFRFKPLLLHPKAVPGRSDLFINFINNKMMRNTFNYTVRALSLIALAAGLTACEIQECTECPEEGHPATLTLTLNSSAVKSTGTPAPAEDNAVNTIDVFIFNGGTSSNYGQLDAYKRFEEGMELMEIRTTTGAKKICVVVNTKDADMSSITNIDQLQALVANLQEEIPGNFTMYGEKDVTMKAVTTETITVSRFISRIAVTSISTDFKGTPYEGHSLTNCLLYLTNVHADKLLYNGEDLNTPLILNETRLNEEDVESTAQPGMLMDRINDAINDAGYTVSHYLHCYSNETSDISSSTKLILQADLNGTTYYYPIPVNQDEYGLPEENGHYGIRRNTVYTYSITVTRPGSLEPDIPLEPGVLNLNIAVKEWDLIPEFDKVF